MSDDTDRASELEEMTRKNALNKRAVFTGESASECIQCDELIPSARQIALPGVQTCVSCAEFFENKL